MGDGDGADDACPGVPGVCTGLRAQGSKDAAGAQPARDGGSCVPGSSATPRAAATCPPGASPSEVDAGAARDPKARAQPQAEDDDDDDDDVFAPAAARRSSSAPLLWHRLTPQGQDLEAIKRLVERNPYAPIRPPSPDSDLCADPASPPLLGGARAGPEMVSARASVADSAPAPCPSAGAPAPSSPLPGSQPSSRAKGCRQRGRSVPPTGLPHSAWTPSLARRLGSTPVTLTSLGAAAPSAAGSAAGPGGRPAPGGGRDGSGHSPAPGHQGSAKAMLVRKIKAYQAADSRHREAWDTFCDTLGDPSHPRNPTKDPARHAVQTLEQFVQQYVVPGTPPPPTPPRRPGPLVPGPGPRSSAPAMHDHSNTEAGSRPVERPGDLRPALGVQDESAEEEGGGVMVPEEGGARHSEGDLVDEEEPWWLDREATALGYKQEQAPHGRDPGGPGDSSHATGAQAEVQEFPREDVEEEVPALRPALPTHGGVPAPSGSAGDDTDASRTARLHPPSPALFRPPGQAFLDSLSDPRTGGHMYKVQLGGAAGALTGESPSGTIVRLQGALGAVFSAAWHGYAALHPAPGRGRLVVRDPRRHPEETCRGFLDAWQRCGYDAYALDRELGLRVNWADVRARYLR